MTTRAPLTANELQAIAYFAVGVTSEGSIAGRDVSYRLSFAGNIGRDGRMQPVANSGYSFGTLQIDLGQHPDVARDLLDGYQAWAALQPESASLELAPPGYDRVLASLQRTGREMRADNAVDIDRSGLNLYLAADEGRSFVHGLDVAHVEGVTAVDAVVGNRDSALERLQRTTLYRDAPGNEQAELAGMFMKLQNQAGRARWPALLERVESGALASSDAVRIAIDGLLPNQSNGHPDYLQSGADNTLRGVGVINALRGAHVDNPLSHAWSNIVAEPLMGPVAARRPNETAPDRGIQYDVVRSLFLTPEGSRRLIAALDRGTSLAEGHPGRQANGSRQAGFYVSGNDLVHWNRDGQGLAFLNGQWRRFDPDALTRIRNVDGTTELRIDEGGRSSTLLTVDPRMPALRPGAALGRGGSGASSSEADRAFADALRARMGAAYSDEQVLALLQRAREAGFREPRAIEASTEHAGTFFMRGDHTTGYAFVRMGLDEAVPSMDQLQAASRALNTSREHVHEAVLASPGIKV